MTMTQLLAKPESWTKEELARTNDGEPCDYGDRHAVRWCFEGAAFHCYWDEIEKLDLILKEARRATGETILYRWNDAPERKHEDILNLLSELSTKLSYEV